MLPDILHRIILLGFFNDVKLSGVAINMAQKLFTMFPKSPGAGGSRLTSAPLFVSGCCIKPYAYSILNRVESVLDAAPPHGGR